MGCTLIDVFGQVGDHFVEELYEAGIDSIFLGGEGPLLAEGEDVLVVVNIRVHSDVFLLKEMFDPFVPRSFK